MRERREPATGRKGLLFFSCARFAFPHEVPKCFGAVRTNRNSKRRSIHATAKESGKRRVECVSTRAGASEGKSGLPTCLFAYTKSNAPLRACADSRSDRREAHQNASLE